MAVLRELYREIERYETDSCQTTIVDLIREEAK